MLMLSTWAATSIGRSDRCRLSIILPGAISRFNISLPGVIFEIFVVFRGAIVQHPATIGSAVLLAATHAAMRKFTLFTASTWVIQVEVEAILHILTVATSQPSYLKWATATIIGSASHLKEVRVKVW